MARTRIVGTEDAVRLVDVGACGPDLILAVGLRHAALFDSLQAIAPTIMAETLRGRWRQNFLLWARALNRDTAARRIMAHWDAAVDRTRAQLASGLPLRVGVLRVLPTALRIYHGDSFPGSILAELGIRPAEFRNPSAAHFEVITLDRLSELASCDWIFYYVWDEGDGRALELERRWIASPAWNALPAVAAGRARRTDDAVWTTGGGILSAHLLLAELRAIFTP